MKTEFKSKARDLRIVGLNTVRAEQRDALMTSAREFFKEKYPEFSDPDNHPELYEDFEKFRRDGFVILTLNRRGAVNGLAAGVAYPETSTAALTHFIATGEPARQLKNATFNVMRNLDVHAVFIELLEKRTARDSAKRKMFAGMGAERVPLVDYEQAIGPEFGEAGRIEDLGLHAMFFEPKPETDSKKSDYAKAYLRAFTRLYDPDLAIPQNADNLARYVGQLDHARWKGPLPTPKAAVLDVKI